MTLSERGLKMIEELEGLRLVAYKSTPNEKYYTIGYGHYGPDVKEGMKITPEAAVKYLKADVVAAECAVDRYASYNWNQNEYDALVSFAFNIGNIHQLTAYGTRSRETIAAKMLEYNKAGGKVLAGLVKRRQREHDLFISPYTEFNIECEGCATFICPCCGVKLGVIKC